MTCSIMKTVRQYMISLQSQQNRSGAVVAEFEQIPAIALTFPFLILN